ncbi:MAG: HNH endonuclease signature motif containing protein [Bacteroidota bacterium]
MVDHSRFDHYIKTNTLLNNENNCVEFTKVVNEWGYARVGKTYVGNNYARLLHRAVWIRHNGPIPEKLLVCHKCDNPKCLNLQHLFLGTVADNNRDKMLKGRCSRVKGESRPNSKLTDIKVREIRNYQGKLSGPKIAALYKVHSSLIYRIWTGEIWSHVKQN